MLLKQSTHLDFKIQNGPTVPRGRHSFCLWYIIEGVLWGGKFVVQHMQQIYNKMLKIRVNFPKMLRVTIKIHFL